MNILNQYYDKFNIFPPILTTIDENDELYIELVKNAIESEKMLSVDDLEKAFGEYDTTDTFDEDYDDDITD